MPVVNATSPAGKIVGSISTLAMQKSVQSFLKNVENQVAWSLAELFKAEKVCKKTSETNA
jgi:hypothetical protein